MLSLKSTSMQGICCSLSEKLERQPQKSILRNELPEYVKEFKLISCQVNMHRSSTQDIKRSCPKYFPIIVYHTYVILTNVLLATSFIPLIDLKV